MLASNKCHQLATSLSTMATSIAREDVQQAASQIAQCASNVFTVSSLCPSLTPSHICHFQAVNAPLQQRTRALDLDVTRANTLPVDYETNIELEWANPSNEIDAVFSSLSLSPLVGCSCRSVRRWQRLLVQRHPTRSECLLSTTKCTSNRRSGGCDDHVAHQGTQRSSECRPAAHDQHFVDLHVVGDAAHRFARQQTTSTTRQCANTISILVAFEHHQRDNAVTSSSIFFSATRSMDRSTACPVCFARRSCSHWRRSRRLSRRSSTISLDRCPCPFSIDEEKR